MNSNHRKAKYIFFILLLLITLGVFIKNGCIVSCNDSDSFVTYVNSKYAYEIKYPSNWKVEGTAKKISDSTEMTFYNKTTSSQGEKQIESMTVHVYENDKKHSPSNWYYLESKQETGGLYPYPDSIVMKTDVNEVNGYPAFYIMTTDYNYDYFLSINNYIYRLSFEKFGGGETWTLPEQIYLEMLNSFRVTSGQ